MQKIMRLRALREGVEQSGASSEAGRVSRGAALAAAPGASPGAAAPCGLRTLGSQNFSVLTES